MMNEGQKALIDKAAVQVVSVSVIRQSHLSTRIRLMYVTGAAAVAVQRAGLLRGQVNRPPPPLNPPPSARSAIRGMRT